MGTVNSVHACHVDQAWLSQLKFIGSFTVPKVDVQIGASYQNIPGLEISANYQDFNSDVSRDPSLGGLGHLPFPAISATATTTVALVPPQTAYYDRINQLDLRMTKILKYGRSRANVGFDLYNVFNKSTITSAGFTYSPSAASNQWLGPSAVIAPRLAKVSLTFDF